MPDVSEETSKVKFQRLLDEAVREARANAAAAAAAAAAADGGAADGGAADADAAAAPAAEPAAVEAELPPAQNALLVHLTAKVKEYQALVTEVAEAKKIVDELEAAENTEENGRKLSSAKKKVAELTEAEGAKKTELQSYSDKINLKQDLPDTFKAACKNAIHSAIPLGNSSVYGGEPEDAKEKEDDVNDISKQLQALANKLSNLYDRAIRAGSQHPHDNWLNRLASGITSIGQSISIYREARKYEVEVDALLEQMDKWEAAKARSQQIPQEINEIDRKFPNLDPKILELKESIASLKSERGELDLKTVEEAKETSGEKKPPNEEEGRLKAQSIEPLGEEEFSNSELGGVELKTVGAKVTSGEKKPPNEEKDRLKAQSTRNARIKEIEKELKKFKAQLADKKLISDRRNALRAEKLKLEAVRQMSKTAMETRLSHIAVTTQQNKINNQSWLRRGFLGKASEVNNESTTFAQLRRTPQNICEAFISSKKRCVDLFKSKNTIPPQDQASNNHNSPSRSGRL